jgi:hypothetical protein
MSEAVHRGGCLCGAVRYEVRGEGKHECFCHCASCRRAVGASPVAWVTFDASSFRVTQGELALFRSSNPVERGFCGACGSSLTYAHAQRPGDIDITTASLDEPAAFKPKRHIWLSDRVDSAPLGDGLPQFSEWGAPS